MAAARLSVASAIRSREGGIVDHCQGVYRSKATPEEIEDLLEQAPKLTIATLNDDGTIHLADVISYFEDGKVFFETSSITKKARNLAKTLDDLLPRRGRSQIDRSTAHGFLRGHRKSHHR